MQPEKKPEKPFDPERISAICDKYESCYPCPLHKRGFCKDHLCYTTPELYAFIDRLENAQFGTCASCGEPLLERECLNRLQGSLYCTICWEKIEQLSPEPEHYDMGYGGAYGPIL